jgi:hypothetical protein
MVNEAMEKLTAILSLILAYLFIGIGTVFAIAARGLTYVGEALISE